MARLYSSGFELQSVATGVEWSDATTGSPSISTSTVRSGAASMRVNPTAATAYVTQRLGPIAPVDDVFARAYINVASLPSSSSTTIMQIRDSGGAGALEIRLTSGGLLQLWNGTDNLQLGSNSSAISTATWYRIEIWGPNGGTGNYSTTANATKAYLDGVNFASGTMGAAIAVGNQLRLGAITSSTMDMYFDDVAVNDSTGTTQNTLPGAGSITHLRPNATGDNSGGTYTGAATGWQTLSEVTPDDATSYTALTVNNTDILDVNLDSSSTGGIGSGDTVTLVAVGARWRAATATACQLQLRIKSQSGGTVLGGTSTTNNTATWNTHDDTAASRQYKLTSYVDPQAGGSWTPSLLDSAQIGIVSSDTSPNPQVSTIWALVEYVPSVSTDLSVNVSDSVTITENVGRVLTSFISTSDSVTVTESVSVAFATAPVTMSVSDSATVTESVKMLLGSDVRTSDSVTITEGPNIGSSIAFDAVTPAAASATSTTIAHTITGSNPVLLVLGQSEDAPTNIITGITYAGVAMTKLGSVIDAVTGSDRSEIWYLAAPATGTNNVIVSRNNISSGAVVTILSLTGADQSNPLDSSNSNNDVTSGNSTPAVSVTTIANNAWLVDVLTYKSNTITATPDAGQTEKSSQTFTGGSRNHTGKVSIRGPISPAASTQMGWTLSAAVMWAIYAIGIKPAGTTGPNVVEDAPTVDPQISVSDSVTITESIGRRLESNRAVSDSATVTENVQLTLVSNVGVSDTVTSSESVQPLLTSFVNKSDSVTITESQTLLIPTLFVGVSDSATITESIGRQLQSFITTSDTATITEAVNTSIANSVSVSDNITITESVKPELSSFVNKSDSVTITEATSVLIPTLLLSVSDNITVTESTGRVLTSFISASDNVTITESRKTELNSFIATSNNVTITENIGRELNSFVNKSDSVTITESVVVSVPGAALGITVSDSITATEAVAVSMPINISVSDSATITEALQRTLGITISKSDSVTITESASAALAALDPQLISVSDSISVTDVLTVGKIDRPTETTIVRLQPTAAINLQLQPSTSTITLAPNPNIVLNLPPAGSQTMKLEATIITVNLQSDSPITLSL